MFENNEFEIDSQSSRTHTTLESYTMKTFGMMAIGLLITTITAGLLSINYTGIRLWMSFEYLPYVLIFAQLGVVIAFSARLFKASLSTTRMMFVIYSILTGVTFSILQYMYRSTTIYVAFGITCVYFGSLCVIGYTTKMNLTKLGPMLMVGLVCLFVVNILGMFMDFSGIEHIICSVGLILFTGLTAYDTQKMKKLYLQYQGDEAMLSRLSMYSALELYLDFINIFLYILRLLGNRD